MRAEPRDEWTLERALNVAAKHREHWPDGPDADPEGRIPGVGYFVSTILGDEIERLRKIIADLGDTSDES